MGGKLFIFAMGLAVALGAEQTGYGSGGSATWGMGAGTRGQALGSAAGLLSYDATAVGSNPAMLSLLEGEAALHHGQWEQGTSWDQVAVVLPFGGIGTLGVAAGLASYGKFEGYDELGNYVGNYEAGEALSAVGVGERIGSLAFGASFYLNRQTIAKDMQLGYAWSGGLLWQASKILGVGAALRSSTEGLANGNWSLDIGAAMGGPAAKSAWGAAVNSRFEAESPSELQLAGTRDFRVGPIGLQCLAAWRFLFPQPELGTSYNWSAGLSVDWQSWALDYAFVPMGDYFEPRHHLGLRYHFSGFAQPEAKPVALAPRPEPTPPPVQALPLPSAVEAPAQAGTAVAVLSDETAAGEALEGQGRLMEALQYYRRGVDKDPQDQVAWKYLARLYARLGHADYARACWQQAARLDPGDPEPGQALQGP